MSLFILPYAYIPDPTRGRPVFNGSIYIGLPDTDPRIPSNQKEALLIQEDGTSVPAEYPISTNAGGVPTYNGSPVAIDVTGTYSFAIDDSKDQQVYYFANAGEETELLASDLRSIMFDLGLTYDDIGTILVTDAAQTSLDDAKYILNTDTGEVWKLPSSIPPGTVVVSLTDDVLVTNNGQFTLKEKLNDITEQVSPLNEFWNGYFRRSQSIISSPAAEGFPATSGGGGTLYAAADSEFTQGWFTLQPNTTISIDDDGLIFDLPIYKTIQLDDSSLIDVGFVSEYIVNELGDQFWLFDGDISGAISITINGSNLITVTINNSIFSDPRFTKLSQSFTLNELGTIPELNGAEALNKALSKSECLSVEQFAQFLDQRPGATAGGTPVSGNNARTINTEAYNTIIGAEINGSSNGISLLAGDYYFEASAPCFRGNAHKIYIVNRDTNDIFLHGTSEDSANSDGTQTRSFVNGFVTLDSDLDVGVNHYITTGGLSNGLGNPVGVDIEVYLDLRIWRVS